MGKVTAGYPPIDAGSRVRSVLYEGELSFLSLPMPDASSTQECTPWCRRALPAANDFLVGIA